MPNDATGPNRDDVALAFLERLTYSLYPVQERAIEAWFRSREGVLVCAPTGTGKSGHIATDGNGNSTVFLQDATVSDLLTAIDLATGVKSATIATTTTAVSATSISSTTTVAVTTTTENLTLHSPVYAVGESVMLGAAPILQAAGLNVSAAVSRQGRNMVDVVAKLRASHVLGKVVIIQTGTNGPVDDSVFAALMQLLPPDATPKVVFLTVHAPRSWVPANNMRIRALPAKYPNVQVLDWDKAAAKIQDQLSYADGGIHLATPVAKQFYANLIFDALGRPDLKK